MNMGDIIHKKREGQPLSAAEIEYWIEGCVGNEIPDYQSAALLMAIFWQGLNESETLALTAAMRDSGTVLDLSSIEGVKVDKHSTGGVGDKTSLIVAPIVAAAGLKMAKMSGRGLDFTGGTLDKLESIPGLQVFLSQEEFMDQVSKIGLAIIGQTAQLAPADQHLYALRDVTATVDSIPLIASSIMSKKLAVGAQALVLDVKYGSGAFMKDMDTARELALIMLQLGIASGLRISAMLTPMEQPLGYAVGNALEIREVIQVLEGRGPVDLRKEALGLAAQLLFLAGAAQSHHEGLIIAEAMLDSGAAMIKFVEMVEAQGGDKDFNQLPRASICLPFSAEKEGYLCSMDCEQVGRAALLLGAGRRRKEDNIDPAAGLLFRHKIGARLSVGQTIAELHCSEESQAQAATELLRQAIEITPQLPQLPPQEYEIIDGNPHFFSMFNRSK